MRTHSCKLKTGSITAVCLRKKRDDGLNISAYDCTVIVVVLVHRMAPMHAMLGRRLSACRPTPKQICLGQPLYQQSDVTRQPNITISLHKISIKLRNCMQSTPYSKGVNCIQWNYQIHELQCTASLTTNKSCTQLCRQRQTGLNNQLRRGSKII